MLRIVSGTNKGQKLSSLDSLNTRPTTDRVKEAVFSIIQFQIEGRKFLDLYAGSAGMGIEALSRGAKEAVFVDLNIEAIKVIEANLASTKLLSKAKIFNMKAESFLNINNDFFDIAYLDPPYYKGEIQKVLETVVQSMNPSGIILCEHARDEKLPSKAGKFMKTKTYLYGKIAVSKYELID